MPMIDVYSVEGTFTDKHALAKDLAAAVMRWEKVPELSLFRKNTAAFVHDLPAGSLSNVDGDENYVRVQVLTPAGQPPPRHALPCPQQSPGSTRSWGNSRSSPAA